ncbi:CTP synthetase [Candidatus Woesearchaeota archaeon CG10_big_fil_rev_8_21_14_0_10_34_12]|nr:MAG: CTP synthetase [Candidatus Woesearchaeota archaeon CG10_big_fil_rev_8_21_14_0_10_34_12]
MTKFIVVVGGVISGVGKGVATASIGRIMKEHGFSVTAIKIDPYINCDAGTLRPTEHGEVWVTEDGGEIDQDLGNYERFLEENIPKRNNITTGQIYKTLIEKERRGDFLGETVQFIPHIPDEIKSRINDACIGKDICLIEIGGTVGDFENIPFLFTLKSLENQVGKENIIYVLVTYMPIPSHIEEMKTKPTQTAIRALNEMGIQPDFILCRGKRALDEPRKKKIEQYANIKSENIISMPDVMGEGTPNTLYIIPLNLEKEEFGKKILKSLKLEGKKQPEWETWQMAVNKMLAPSKKLDIAIVGKYLDIGDYKLTDSYISIKEALKHASAKNDAELNISWIDSKEFEKNPEKVNELKQFNGIIVPGGFGSLGVEGKIKAIQFVRENNIPFLGLCFGLQLAVVEFARNVCLLEEANSTEINQNANHPVIDILPWQKNIENKGGTMRLGAYKAILKDGTRTREIYGTKEIYERHRHRYEINPKYHNILSEKGLVLSGTSEDNILVEFIELPNHKFFIATQAHPEFKSCLLHPAPLFDAFVKASLTRE